jgi:hypothetical protein
LIHANQPVVPEFSSATGNTVATEPVNK